MKFKTELSWDGNEGGKALVGKDVTYRFDTPEEFGGKAIHPSPEEYFISSFGACLITTFLFFRKKIKFLMKNIKVDVKGKLEHINNEGNRFTQIDAILTVEIESDEDKEKIIKCYNLTKKFCPLSQTLRRCVPIELTLKIETQAII
jgi:uncharacterized OsmC-like protein